MGCNMLMLVCWVLALVTAAPQPEPAPPAATGANRYAVVIGINGYQDAAMPPLRFCEGDARAMHALLTDAKSGGVPAANATLLIGKEATTRAVKSALNRLRQVPKDSTVFIYYSGHGAKDGADGYLATYDADPADLPASALSDLELKASLAKVPSDRIILMLDCCYAAALMKDKKAVFDSGDLLERFTGKGLAVLSAAGPREEAIEAADLKRSVFTHYLLEGMGGKGDTNRDGAIVLTELTEYVDRMVAEEARKRGGVQRPVVDLKQLQEPSKFLVTADSTRLAEIEREKAAGAAVTKGRMEKLRGLFTEDKITAEQFAEGRRLMEAVEGTLDEAGRKRRAVYVDLAEGKLDAKYLAGALGSIVVKPAEKPPEPAPTEPAITKSPDVETGVPTAWLEKLIGTWDATQTTYSPLDASKSPVVERGTETYEWHKKPGEITGTIQVEGRPAATTWQIRVLSNGTTTIKAGELNLVGRCDPKERTFDMRGELRTPNGESGKLHMVMRLVSDATITTRLWLVAPGGAELLILDSTARKRAAGAEAGGPKGEPGAMSPEGRIMERMIGRWSVEQFENQFDGEAPNRLTGVEVVSWETRGVRLRFDVTLRDSDGDEMKQLGSLSFDAAERNWLMTFEQDGHSSVKRGTFDTATSVFSFRGTRRSADNVELRETMTLRLAGPDRVEMVTTFTLPDGRTLEAGRAVSTRQK